MLDRHSILGFILVFALPSVSYAEPGHHDFETAARHACQADAPRVVCECALERLMDGVADPTTLKPDETTLLQTVQGCREVVGRGQWASFAEARRRVQERVMNAAPIVFDRAHVEVDAPAQALLEPVAASLLQTPSWALRAWQWDASAKQWQFTHPEEGWSVWVHLALRDDHVVISAITRHEAPVTEAGSPVGQDGQPALAGEE